MNSPHKIHIVHDGLDVKINIHPADGETKLKVSFPDQYARSEELTERIDKVLHIIDLALERHGIDAGERDSKEPRSEHILHCVSLRGDMPPPSQQEVMGIIHQEMMPLIAALDKGTKLNDALEEIRRELDTAVAKGDIVYQEPADNPIQASIITPLTIARHKIMQELGAFDELTHISIADPELADKIVDALKTAKLLNDSEPPGDKFTVEACRAAMKPVIDAYLETKQDIRKDQRESAETYLDRHLPERLVEFFRGHSTETRLGSTRSQ